MTDPMTISDDDLKKWRAEAVQFRSMPYYPHFQNRIIALIDELMAERKKSADLVEATAPFTHPLSYKGYTLLISKVHDEFTQMTMAVTKGQWKKLCDATRKVTP